MKKDSFKFDTKRVIIQYSFKERDKSAAKKLISRELKSSATLLVGFGGTISSGYTPTHETIVPLHPSPAIKQINYFNLFGISNIEYNRLDVLAKDSRDITDTEVMLLLDILHLAPNRKILITAGTYMLPKLAEVVATLCKTLQKKIVLTGSILPAGFVASDADANIWSAITVLSHFEKQKYKNSLQVALVFHGKVFSSIKEFKELNLHPKKMHKMVIQYPLSSVPVEGVL